MVQRSRRTARAHVRQLPWRALSVAVAVIITCFAITGPGATSRAPAPGVVGSSGLDAAKTPPGPRGVIASPPIMSPIARPSMGLAPATAEQTPRLRLAQGLFDEDVGGDLDAYFRKLKKKRRATGEEPASTNITTEAPSFLLGPGEFFSALPPQDTLLNKNGLTFRTMCVRLCDGYYWPVSFATTADRFARDEDACQSSCSAPAKLFTYANPGQDIEQMVDRQGIAYTKLKTAFAHRERLDPSCRCQDEPWSASEIARHRAYALEAAADRKAAAAKAANAKSTTRSKSTRTSTRKPSGKLSTSAARGTARAEQRASAHAGYVPVETKPRARKHWAHR